MLNLLFIKRLILISVFIISTYHLFAQKQTYKIAIAAFYNCENFYDTTDNPSVDDNDFTPNGVRNYTSQRYNEKVAHIATVLSQIGTDISADGAAFIGLAEIENDTVLNDLIHHPLLQNRNYEIIHYDSKDIRGIDVAFLYNPKYFNVIGSKKLPVKIHTGTSGFYFSRDVLWVKGLLDGDTVHVLVNHWPSRRGGEERSSGGRFTAAQVNKNIIDSIHHFQPAQKIILMGDLNDDPVSPSITQVLKAKGKMDEVRAGELYNPWVDLYKRGIGTLAYNDAWSLFDQIIINYNWLPKKQNGYFFYQPHVFNKDLMVENMGKYKGYPMRTYDGNTYRGGYSDHFPTYLVFLKKMP